MFPSRKRAGENLWSRGLNSSSSNALEPGAKCLFSIRHALLILILKVTKSFAEMIEH